MIFFIFIGSGKKLLIVCKRGSTDVKTILFILYFYLQLRLMYECNPMAFIIEQAGGTATTGTKPILDIVPEAIHQRTPIFLGSKDDVEELIACHKKYENSS